MFWGLERIGISGCVRFDNHSQAMSTKLIYLREEKSTLMRYMISKAHFML